LDEKALNYFDDKSERRSMKLVALTDIHGAYERVENILKKEQPDLTIIGGDLTTVGSVKEAEEALAHFRKLTPAIFCVAGNMDLPQHDVLFERLDVSLNGRGRMHEGIGFFGLSAAPISPLRTPYELSEDVLSARIAEGYRTVKSAPKRVFVPHAPPYGTKVDIIHTGIHVGSTAVRDFIEDHQPDLVICGHIHESRGEDMLGKTHIVNCGPAMKGYYCVVDFSGKMMVEIRNG